jgi:type II secretory pathway component PulC
MRTPLLLVLAFAGCATTGRPASTEKPLLDEKQETSEARPPSAPPQKPASAPTSMTASKEPGVIPRSALVSVLDAAPGVFLQHVDSEPRFVSGHFVGWKLVAFFPGDPRFAGIDLRAGDVVTRVNGQSIEHPEQLMEVWNELRTSKELVVEVEREGRPRTLRWTISP